ncbi:PAS/PAC sensor hybrid histidine kinase (fragment) [uncultured Desulfobacterium sp.]|uniref:histidine kinase n=1 Tax=uncultured Desulfobacterium sp. TaxID=201089 RepID=A0A445N223_9BACT
MQPGKYVRLTVSDTGTGMNAETIERIFDPYFTTKEIGKGTGMGLAVVHGIVKEHEGLISVETEPGKGSTFHIWFPAVEETPRHGAEKIGDVPKGTESIIFVDDEKTLVRISTGMLERLGYRVEGRTDPEQALEIFRTSPHDFDLVITDTSMPKMTGDMLAQEITRIRPDMKIIICTGYSELMDETKAEQLGIKSFIMKPLDLRKLANTVREVLDDKKYEEGTFNPEH